MGIISRCVGEMEASIAKIDAKPATDTKKMRKNLAKVSRKMTNLPAVVFSLFPTERHAEVRNRIPANGTHVRGNSPGKHAVCV